MRIGDCYSDLDDRQTYFQGRELKQLVPIYINVVRFYLLLVNTLLMFFLSRCRLRLNWLYVRIWR